MSSSTDSDGLLQVGRVGRPHGVRGDVFVDLTTHIENRAAVGSRLLIDGKWREITKSAPTNGRWRVHFEGLDVREEAAMLTGQFIYAEPVDDPDALWVHEMIGARVVEVDGTDRGRCVAVVENPAADLLELDSGALVPATFVVSVDAKTSDAGADEAEASTVTIDPPAGLFDINTD